MNHRPFGKFIRLSDGFQLLIAGAAFIIAISTLPACKREISLPQTSPEAEPLRWVERADVLADFRQHVEREHDMRFLSLSGLSFATEFPGLNETPETQRLVKEYGSRRIEGTTDVVSSWEQQRLLQEVSFYATRYNSMLLGYFECLSGPDSASRQNIVPQASPKP